jgi:hypothetical protein
LPIFAILFRPFGCIASKHFYIIWLYNLSIFGVPDEGYYIPDEGYYVLDEGYYIPDEGYYVPGEGYYVPDEGYYVPDEGYYINAWCVLDLISTFLLQW